MNVKKSFAMILGVIGVDKIIIISLLVGAVFINITFSFDLLK